MIPPPIPQTHQKIQKNLANQTNHKEPNLGRLPELSVSTSCREVDRCWWCINYISDQNMCIYLWTCLWLGINSMCMHLNHTKAPVHYPASKQMIITRRVYEEVLKTSSMQTRKLQGQSPHTRDSMSIRTFPFFTYICMISEVMSVPFGDQPFFSLLGDGYMIYTVYH